MTENVIPNEQAGAKSVAEVNVVEPSNAVETKTQTQDTQWVESIGSEPPRPTPSVDDFLPPPPRPGYDGGYDRPGPVAAPIDNDAIINTFVRDPRGFIERITAERTAAEVAPVIGALREIMTDMHVTQVNAAHTEAIGRLRDYARSDSSLADERVRNQVKKTYQYFVESARRGDREAIAALRNPISPRIITEAARAQLGLDRGNAPISYAGGSIESRSTAVSSGPQVLNEAASELAREWRIPTDKWLENERAAKGGR